MTSPAVLIPRDCIRVGENFAGGFFGSLFAVDMVIGYQTRELQAGLIRHYPT